MLVAIPVIVLPLVAFGRAVRRRSRAAQDTLADASAYAAELIGAVRTLQAFTNEQLAQARVSPPRSSSAYAAAVRRNQARAMLTAIVIFLVFGSVVVVLWVGAQDVLAGDITPGRLGQFVLYAVFAASALGELSQVWGEISQAAGAAERLFEILAMPSRRSSAPAQPVPLPQPARGEVAFDERALLPIRRRPEAPVLERRHSALRPGEKVAIVGPSGAGKSTIFHLILRFYDPSSGHVGFDGVRLPDADPAELRRASRWCRRTPRSSRHERAREHPLRPAGCDRCGDRKRRRRRARCRVHPAAAARLRYAGRRARHHAVGRPAPAHRHRARDPARGAAPAARRGDVLTRCRKRDAGADRRSSG